MVNLKLNKRAKFVLSLVVVIELEVVLLCLGISLATALSVMESHSSFSALILNRLSSLIMIVLIKEESSISLIRILKAFICLIKVID